MARSLDRGRYCAPISLGLLAILSAQATCTGTPQTGGARRWPHGLCGAYAPDLAGVGGLGRGRGWRMEAVQHSQFLRIGRLLVVQFALALGMVACRAESMPAPVPRVDAAVDVTADGGLDDAPKDALAEAASGSEQDSKFVDTAASASDSVSEAPDSAASAADAVLVAVDVPPDVSACQAAACGDGNACTVDACGLAGACTHANAADGSDCEGVGACDLFICVQGACVGKPKLFQVTLDSPNGSGFVTQVVVVPDGFAVLYSFSPSFDAYTPQIARWTAYGELAWNKSVTTTTFDSGNALLAAQDSFVVAGVHYGADPLPTQNVWLIRLDKDGNVGWQFNAAGETNNQILVSLVSDGTDIVAAGRWSSNPFKQLIRVDGTGKMIWERSYGTVLDYAEAITLTSAGFGIVGRDTSTDYDAPHVLASADAQGNQLWHATIDYKGGVVSSLLGLPDGFAVAGNSLSGFTVLRTDVTGKTLWKYGLYSMTATAAGALVEAGGGFTLLGTTSTKAGGSLQWLHTDALGNVQWQQMLGNGTTGGGIVRLADGYVICGDLLGVQWTQPHAVVLRTDNYGHFSCAEAGVCLALSATACDDGNVCTADDCDGKIGCIHLPIPDGATCTAAGALCKAGICVK